jgi:outer membrane biosynthesis protein TonB
MRIPIALFVAALFCAASAVEAQTAPSAAPLPEPPTAASGQLNLQKPIGGVQLLSDTEGVDFKPYLEQWQRISEAAWQPLISNVDASEKGGSGLQPGTVAIRFKILPNGKLMDESLVLDERSGQTTLDKAAWQSVTNSAYPALPEEFQGPYLELRAYFHYDKQPAK